MRHAGLSASAELLVFIHYIIVRSVFVVYHQTDSMGAKVPWNFCSRECKFQQVPRNKSSVIHYTDIVLGF